MAYIDTFLSISRIPAGYLRRAAGDSHLENLQQYLGSGNFLLKMPNGFLRFYFPEIVAYAYALATQGRRGLWPTIIPQRPSLGELLFRSSTL